MVLFPPGGIASTVLKSSPWRIFDFVMHVIQQAILPILSLRKLAEDWVNICNQLRSSPRKRKSQFHNFDT